MLSGFRFKQGSDQPWRKKLDIINYYVSYYILYYKFLCKLPCKLCLSFFEGTTQLDLRK